MAMAPGGSEVPWRVGSYSPPFVRSKQGRPPLFQAPFNYFCGSTDQLHRGSKKKLTGNRNKLNPIEEKEEDPTLLGPPQPPSSHRRPPYHSPSSCFSLSLFFSTGGRAPKALAASMASKQHLRPFLSFPPPSPLSFPFFSSPSLVYCFIHQNHAGQLPKQFDTPQTGRFGMVQQC